jgi:hypothetical protein
MKARTPTPRSIRQQTTIVEMTNLKAEFFIIQTQMERPPGLIVNYATFVGAPNSATSDYRMPTNQ